MAPPLQQTVHPSVTHRTVCSEPEGGGKDTTDDGRLGPYRTRRYGSVWPGSTPCRNRCARRRTVDTTASWQPVPSVDDVASAACRTTSMAPGVGSTDTTPPRGSPLRDAAPVLASSAAGVLAKEAGSGITLGYGGAVSRDPAADAITCCRPDVGTRCGTTTQTARMTSADKPKTRPWPRLCDGGAIVCCGHEWATCSARSSSRARSHVVK